MRKLVVFSLLVMACGDSGGGGARPTGTVAGRAFTPTEVRAVRAGSGTTPCTLPVPGSSETLDFGVAGLAIDFTSYADACGDYGAGQCTLHANAQNVTIIFARLDPTGAEPALVKDTYTVQPSPTIAIPDSTGLLTVAYAQALGTGATPDCAGTPSPAVQGGTLRLDDVGSPVKGYVDLTFQDGSTLRGDFTATVCPGPGPEICALATTQTFCTPPPVCVAE